MLDVTRTSPRHVLLDDWRNSVDRHGRRASGRSRGDGVAPERLSLAGVRVAKQPHPYHGCGSPVRGRCTFLVNNPLLAPNHLRYTHKHTLIPHTLTHATERHSPTPVRLRAHSQQTVPHSAVTDRYPALAGTGLRSIGSQPTCVRALLQMEKELQIVSAHKLTVAVLHANTLMVRDCLPTRARARTMTNITLAPTHAHTCTPAQTPTHAHRTHTPPAHTNAHTHANANAHTRSPALTHHRLTQTHAHTHANTHADRLH